MSILSFIILFFFSCIYSFKNYDALNALISIIIIMTLYGKTLYKSKLIFNKKNIIISLVVSVMITLFIHNSFIFNYKDNELTIKNKSEEYITIDGIYLNEKRIKTHHNYISDYDHIDNTNIKTEYKQYNKIDSSYKMTLSPGEEYSINIKNKKNIEVDFQRNEKTYSILVNGKSYKVNKYTYQKVKIGNFIYESYYKYKYKNIKNADSFILNTVFILIILYVYFTLMLSILDDKRKLSNMLLLLIIEFNGIINIEFLSKILIVLIYLLLMKLKNEKDKVKKNNIIYLISSVLIAFTFIGDRLINNKFNINIFVTYLITVLFIYIVIPYIYSFISLIVKKNKCSTIGNIRKHRIIVFSITLLICMIYLYWFSPFIIHADTSMQLNDVKNLVYSNWHPYFHTVILRFFNNLFGSVNYFMIFRIIIYSLLINSILFYFNKKGLRLFKVYLYSILITIIPVTGIMLVTLVKDIDFTIAVIALCFYLIMIINDYEYFKKNKLNYLYLFLSLFFTAVFRHNGIYVFIGTTLFLLIIIIKSKKVLLLVPTIISVLSVYLVSFPLYKEFKVKPAPRNFDIISMVHGLTYLVVENKDVDDDVYKFLLKIYDNNDMRLLYDKYNIDLTLHYNELKMRDKKIDKGKLVDNYLLQFTKTPMSLIIDRLYGTDLIWNVSEKDSVKTYKYQIIYDEFSVNYSKLLSVKCNNNKLIGNILLFIAKNETLNTLLFRAGIYIDLLIILIGYSIIKRKKVILAGIPLYINIITLLLTMAHQSYRYVWMIGLISLVLLLAITCDKRIDKN